MAGKITLLICAGTYLGSLGFHVAGLGLNLTGSMPKGIYRKVVEVPKPGSLVLACLPPTAAELAKTRGYLRAGNCPGDVQPVIKQVVASSGDRIAVTSLGVTINQELVKNSKPLRTDSQGLALAPYSASKSLAHDEFFLLSTLSTQSFDSRYFGPIRRSQIIAVIKPLIVFNR